MVHGLHASASQTRGECGFAAWFGLRAETIPQLSDGLTTDLPVTAVPDGPVVPVQETAE